MKNRPFRFLEKQSHVDRLRAALQPSGFELTERSELALTFARGDSPSLEIVWEEAWESDGQLRADRLITVRQGRDTLAEIDVDKLLRSKLAQPLADEIIRAVASAVLVRQSL